MINYLLFNNNESYSDLGLLFASTPSLPFTVEKVNETEVEGRDGTLTEKTGTFNNSIIKVSFRLTDEKNYYRKIEILNDWFTNIEDEKLRFSWDLEKYFKVKYVVVENILRQFEWYGEFEVSFVCEPFRYYLDNTTLTNPTVLYSPQLAYNSEPIVSVTGTGNITLTINGLNIVLTGIDGTVIIDSVLKECYSSTFENLNNKMTGEFPKLTKGLNTISYTGTITNLEITPNWRSL